MGKLNWWLIMNEKRLFDLREYKDLSQIKLADYLGITQQTYSLWEIYTLHIYHTFHFYKTHKRFFQ